MALQVTLLRPDTGDVVKIPLVHSCFAQIITENTIRQRFGMLSSHQELELQHPYNNARLPFAICSGGKQWMLEGGKSYVVMWVAKVESIPVVMPKSEVVFVSSSSDDDIRPVLQKDFHPRSPPKVLTTYRISALEKFLGVTGSSELSVFRKQETWEVQHVTSLPRSYNGNIVFEFPPLSTFQGRGHFLQGMDRENDCYAWTRIVSTSARIHPSNQYTVGKVHCTGALECPNPRCVHVLNKGIRNGFSWIGRTNATRAHRVGERVAEGGVICGFCSERPLCVRGCLARLFFMYPRSDVDPKILPFMSRLAIHMGTHEHLSRKISSRESVKKVADLVGKEVAANPGATPGRIKNVASGKLIRFLHPDTAENLSEEEEKEIWDSLQVISTPAKFAQVLRSVKIVRPDACELDCIIRMQKNIRFPYIQRFLYPGQASATDRCHIFKMSVKGPGSGLDLLRRMQLGGSLDGAWVMFDVMHRCTKGWLTFSAHVYDHNFRALCTIFTCELRGEDAGSLEKAWTLMIDVAKENGLENITIKGFMADNAEAGWIAVRNVFFGGFPDPERERSDAFHFRQSFIRHSQDGIKPEKREAHFKLWERMRHAASYVEAYRLADEIRVWWSDGNCIPGKLKMLEGWIAWWVVRWRQWGSSIRLSLGPMESALMPNTTGAESVHASMRSSQPKKKVTVVEACETDQNRAASQIAAFIAYENGQTRGRGPTIFELAFRNSESIGSPQAHEDALNMLLSSTGKYDLLRTDPLHGDIRTNAFKRRDSVIGGVSPHDSHRHDQVLRTTPNTRGFKRRNIDFSEVAGTLPDSPAVISIPSSDDAEFSDDVEIIATPRRPPTRAMPSPSPVVTPVANDPHTLPSIKEVVVGYGAWHLRRTSRVGPGPICNASMRGSSSAREECKNHIKKVSFPNTSGVVGIAVHGERLVAGIPMKALLWFCPNNDCHRRPPRRHIAALPPVPLLLPVSAGTNLTPLEIEFLLSRTFALSGMSFAPPIIPRPPSPRMENSSASPPSALDLRIDLNTFPEKIQFNQPHERQKSRNGKITRQRIVNTREQENRIQSAMHDKMRVLREIEVKDGKGWGKQILLMTHEDDGRIPQEYWVQICCFPSCSCDDFYKRHTRGKPYMSCKHLLWIYKNVFRCDLQSHMSVRQPVMTIGEVREMLLRQIVD